MSPVTQVVPGPRFPATRLVRVFSERQRACSVLCEVDQRLDGEERADRDCECRAYCDVEERVRRGLPTADSDTAARLYLHLLGRAHVHRPHDPEVVVEADERGEHADDHEPDPAVVVRRGEDVELPDEAAAERQPGEAEHFNAPAYTEKRPLPAEAGEVVERDGHAELPLPRGD